MPAASRRMTQRRRLDAMLDRWRYSWRRSSARRCLTARHAGMASAIAAVPHTSCAATPKLPRPSQRTAPVHAYVLARFFAGSPSSAGAAPAAPGTGDAAGDGDGDGAAPASRIAFAHIGQYAFLFLSLLRFTPTHRWWNHSWHPSHWNIGVPSSGRRHTQYSFTPLLRSAPPDEPPPPLPPLPPPPPLLLPPVPRPRLRFLCCCCCCCCWSPPSSSLSESRECSCWLWRLFISKHANAHTFPSHSLSHSQITKRTRKSTKCVRLCIIISKRKRKRKNRNSNNDQ